MSTENCSGDSIPGRKAAAFAAFALMLCLVHYGIASAQCSTSGNAPCAGALLTSYYNTASSPQVQFFADNTVELINPVGSANGAILNQPVVNACAMIYVFDTNENMGECCGCLVTPQGLLTLSVKDNLTGNWAGPGGSSAAGTIDVISASTNGGNAASCNAATSYTLYPALNGYITHSLGSAEVQFADAGDPSSTLQTSLITQCAHLHGNNTSASFCSCNNTLEQLPE